MFPRVARVLELEAKRIKSPEITKLLIEMTYREFWEYQSIKRSQEVPPTDLELEMMKVLRCDLDN